MDITIDNLFAFLIFLLLVITFLGYIVPSTYLSFTTTEQHQLEVIAEGTMDKFLLSTGDPLDWGKDITINASTLSAFGLRKNGGDVYELDIDKALRIANVGPAQLPTTVQIDSDTVSRLLGLREPRRYDYSLRIIPALNVSVRILANYSLKGTESVPSILAVTVLNPDGRPASNTNVTGLYLLMNARQKGNDETVYMNYTYFTQVSNWEGKCNLNFTSWIKAVESDIGSSQLKKTSTAVTIYGDYYGIRSTSSFALSSALQGSIVGRYLIVEFPIEELPKGARQMQNATALSIPPYYVYLDYLHNETNGQSGMIVNAGSKKYRVYALGNDVDDDVSFIFVPVKYLGQYTAMTFMRPPINLGSQSATPGGVKTSVLRRLVRIGSWHYIVQITVWRQAQF